MRRSVSTPSILATSIAGLLGLLGHTATAQTTGAFSAALLGTGNFDAALGLEVQKTYFNAVNAMGGTVTVNGVQFVGTTALNPADATYSTANFGNQISPGPGNAHGVTGNFGALVNDFNYGDGTTAQTFTVGGATPLEVGKTYTVTFYDRAWATGNRTQIFTTSSGATATFNQDLGVQGQASVLRYTFVASGPTETISAVPQAGASFHLYAFTTEDVFNNTLSSGTDWTTAAWSVAAPNRFGANANFTAQAAPATLNLDQNQTVGHLQFDGANAWTLSSTAGRVLTLQGDVGGVSVLSSVSGTHTIATNLLLRSELVKMGNGNLRISGSILGNAPLSVNGGVLELTGSNPRFGDTRVNLGGTLILRHQNALSSTTLDTQAAGAGALVFAAGAGDAFTLGGLRGANPLVLENSTAGPIALSVGGNLANTTYSGSLSGAGSFIKKANSVLTFTNAHTFTGSTTLTGGTLRLAYVADASMLSDTAALILNGGTLDLAGTGFHVEQVGSTVLGGAAALTRSAGASAINLNSITGPGTLAIGTDGIATTDNFNSPAGILLGRITVNGNWAVNSTNSADGAIVALTSYTDVNRLGGIIADGLLSNVRIIEAGTTGNITLAAPGTTTINSLLQGALGTPATVDVGAGNTLRLGSGDLLLPAGNGALTFTGNGSLTAGAADNAAATLTLQNQNTVNPITINAAIPNNGTGQVGLVKAGAGLVVLTGTNTYTGGTTLMTGTLSIGASANVGGAGSTITFNGGILQLTGIAQANLDGHVINTTTFNGGIDVNAAAHTVTLNQELSGPGNFIKQGAGRLIMTSPTNSFTGLTRLEGGLLNVASISDYGVPSSIGARTLAQETSEDDGIGLWFRGGGIEYTGATAQSTNRHIRINAGTNAVISASGSNPSATLSFTNTGPNINFFENGGNRGVLLTGTNTGLNTFAMRLDETGGVTNLLKQGTGTWYITPTANPNTGVTQFGGGILNIASISDYGVPSSIGARAQAQETATGDGIGLWFRGGTLQYTGSTPQSTNREIRILGSGAGVTNTIDASGSVPTATLSFTKTGSNINLFDTPGIRTLNLTGTNAGANQFNISLTDQSANATSLAKNGPGMWVLSPSVANTSTYSGVTTINNGTLKITVGTALGSTTGATVVAGGTATTALLALENNITVTGETLSLGGRAGASALLPHLSNVSGNNLWTGSMNFVAGGNNFTLESQAGTLTISGQVSGSATTGVRFFNLQGAGIGAITGNIVDGSAQIILTKMGTGKWTLSGANTYSGATNVNEGTLALAGASSNSIPKSPAITVAAGATLDASGLSGGGVTVASGQILGGRGTVVGSVTVPAAGNLAAGGGLIGTLNVGNLVFPVNPGSATFALGSPGNSSQVNASGTLTLPVGGKPLTVNFVNDNNASGLGALGAGTYQLISSAGFANAFSPSQLSVGFAPNFKSYGFSQSGNTLNVTVGEGNVAYNTGGVFSHVPFTPANQMADTNVGLDLNKTYQNTANINGGALVINGVPFAAGGLTTGTNWSLSGAATTFPGPWTNPLNSITGQLASLIGNFTYGGNPAVFTLSGLTLGQTYSLTMYGAAYGPAGGRVSTTITSSSGAVIANYDANEGGSGNGNLLRYTFTASAPTEALTFTPLQAGNTYHFYGFSNEQVFNNTWQSAGNGTWSGATWANTGNTGAVGANPNIVPTYAGSNASFPAQSVPTTVDLSADTTTGHVQFDGLNSWSLSSTTGRSLTLQGDVAGVSVLSTPSGTHRIAVPVILQNDTVKTGSGTLVVTNSINGPDKALTVSAGTLQFGDGVSEIGSFNGRIVNNSHLVFANASGQAHDGLITGGGNLTKSGAGTLTLTRLSSYAGRTTINGGTLQLAASQGLAHYRLNGAAGTGVPSDFGAIVDASGNGRNGTVEGFGATFVPGQFDTAVNLGGTSRITVQDDAAFHVNTYTISTWFNLTDTTVMNGLFDTRNGGQNTFDLKIMPGTVDAASVIHGDFGTGATWINTAADINGLSIAPNTWHMVTYVIDGVNNRFNAYFDGVQKVSQGFAGTPLFMSGGTLRIGETTDANSQIRGSMDEVYLYGEAFDPGQVTNLYLNSVGSLPAATPVLIATGATLDLSGRVQTVASLADTAPGQVGSVLNNDPTSSVNFTIAPAAATSTTFHGVISDGAGQVGVTLNGSGTQVLAGTNTYTGPTIVKAGTLVVDGSIAGSATSIVGGTLSGSGTTGAVTLATGILAPGSGPGVLSATGNVAFNGGTFSIDLVGSTLGTGYDQLNVTGLVAFGGLVELSLNLGAFDPIEGSSFTILNNDLADAIDFDFANGRAFALGGIPLNEGDRFSAGLQDFTISYAAGTGANDVVLIAVPEPGTVTALLGGLAMLLGTRRRKSKQQPGSAL